MLSTTRRDLLTRYAGLSAEERTLPLFTTSITDGDPMNATTEETTTTSAKRRARFSDQVTFRLAPKTRRKLERIRKAQGFDSLAQAARFALEQLIGDVA